MKRRAPLFFAAIVEDLFDGGFVEIGRKNEVGRIAESGSARENDDLVLGEDVEDGLNRNAVDIKAIGQRFHVERSTRFRQFFQGGENVACRR